MLESIDAKDLRIEDILMKVSSPSHIEIIGDENIIENGDKLYLLFQGNTPAQIVYLVKNLESDSISPWYQF